jgi:hypothetical protein
VRIDRFFNTDTQEVIGARRDFDARQHDHLRVECLGERACDLRTKDAVVSVTATKSSRWWAASITMSIGVGIDPAK